MTTETSTFAERFRLTLEFLNYSRGRCAQELGVDKSLVGRWVSGAVVPREHNLTRWTEIVRRAQPAFSLGDWRLDADAFATRLRGAAETPAVAPVSALASRPTLAVLPFADLSERRTDAWLSDGIAEDIVTDLVRGRSLLPVVLGPGVASRGPDSDIKSVGRALGARYVLTGSVRLNPDDVRVSLQLTDAEAGMLVWAERFEGGAPDVRRQLNFIVATSVRSVAAAVAVAEQERALKRPPAQLDAWEAYHCGMAHWARHNTEVYCDLLRQSIRLAPEFAAPKSTLAGLIVSEGTRGVRPLGDALGEAEALARDAVRVDPEGPDGYAVLSWIVFLRGDAAQAIALASQAISRSPDSVSGQLALGRVLTFDRQYAKARDALQTTIRLSAGDPAAREAEMLIGAGLYLERRVEEAASTLRLLLLRWPNYSHANRWMAMALGQLGKREEARDVLALLNRVAPNHLQALIESRPVWCRPDDFAWMLDGLRRAGVPTDVVGVAAA